MSWKPNKKLAQLLILAFVSQVAMVAVADARSGSVPLGNWRLISVVTSTADKPRDLHPFGQNPTGVLSYTPDGRMAAMIAYDGRSPLSGDRTASPAEERARAYATFFAYAGRYDLKGNVMTHHIEIASVPNWVGTDIIRQISLNGDRLTLTTPPMLMGGRLQSSELVWQRMR